MKISNSIEKNIYDIAYSISKGICPNILKQVLLSKGFDNRQVNIMMRWAEQHWHNGNV